MIGMSLSMASNPSQVTVIQQAIAVLRKYGSDAHVYLPGVGMLNGLTAANYLDSAGTTAATVDQPVGLVLDAAGSLGVELVTNGDFSNGLTGWVTTASMAASGGTLVCTATPSGDQAYQNAAIATGKTYEITFQIIACSAGGFRASLGTTFGPVYSAPGVYTARLVSTSGAVTGVQCIGATTGSIDNISVREVTGIHASQPTTASKPILRRGAVAINPYSGDLSNAAWYSLTSATLTASTVSFTASATSGVEQRLSIVGGTASRAFTVAALVSCASGTVNFRLKNTHATVVDNFSQEFVATTTPQIFAFSVTNGASVGNSAQNFGIVNSSTSPIVATLISGGCALFQGTYTAAQIQALGGIPLTTTAPASTALGPQYWAFDGSNDSLSLGSVPFQMSDDICVIASASSTLASSERTVFSVTGSVVNNPLCPSLVFGSDSRFKAYWRNDAGTLDQSGQTGTVQSLGSVFVVSALKVGNSKTLRVNGVLQSGAGGTNLGATTLTTANIGAFVNAVGAVGGNLQGSTGPVIAIKGTVPDADLLLLEKFVANLSGVII